MELPGVTEIAAIENYITVLKDSLSCVLARDLVAAPHHEFPYTVQFGPGDPEARIGETDLILSFIQAFKVVSRKPERGWVVDVEAYSYGVSYLGKGPLFAYDWHPHRHRTQPHFHIKQGAGFLGMNKLHFPSGHVAIEAVVRFLIEEMAIPSARADWDSILTENQNRFEADCARSRSEDRARS